MDLKLNRKFNKKFKAIEARTFIVPLFVIMIIFFISYSHMTDFIKEHYYDLRTDEALKVARSYATSISKSEEAEEIVNQLLEEKLRVASQTMLLYEGQQSNALYSKLAEILELDELDYYNSQGELQFSNLKEVIGWKVYEGHPIDKFLKSNAEFLVEDIRQDVITGNFYKYGYLKYKDGSLVQFGVSADKIQSFLHSFDKEQLLAVMKEEKDALRICFINESFIVTESTDPQRVGTIIKDPLVMENITRELEFSYVDSTSKKDESFVVFVPVSTGIRTEGVSALAIQYSLSETNATVRQVSMFVMIALLMVYLFLLYVVTATYKKNNNLIKLAYFDSLTGLPNKQFLKEFMKKELDCRDTRSKALMLFNCSNFKIINMTKGYEYGDEVLKELARILYELENENVKLFRFTADRFVLYIQSYTDAGALVAMAESISEKMNQPMVIQNTKQYIEIQMGIVEINSSYTDVGQIIKEVSISLNDLSESSQKNYIFFNKEMEKVLQREEMIEKVIRTALTEHGESPLYLEYQPQKDFGSDKITGFEALARMTDPELGQISPVEFIAVAERKQLIIPLGKLILKEACLFSRRLNQLGFNGIRIAVNVSGVEMLQEQYVENVLKIVRETGAKASELELEITESMLLLNFEGINTKLKVLSDHHIDIALDDFGTGYSSFYKLQELNVHTIKIDRSFINRIDSREHTDLITADIISMAHKIGLRVIAEGVETQKQHNYLSENGCDLMQGYLFSKPLKEQAALELLRETNLEDFDVQTS